ncbi:hypothetical protein D3C84_563210 [compost metagenome]
METNKVILKGLFETHLLTARQRVLARHDQHQPVDAIGAHIQPCGTGSCGADTDIGHAGFHGMDNLVAGAFNQIDANFRVCLNESTQIRRQVLRHRREVNVQPRMATYAFGVLAELSSNLSQVLK